MRVAIVQYNSGNVRSVKNAFDRLGVKTVLTNDAELLRSADRVVFPGVGEASSAMSFLRERGLDSTIVNLTQPVLAVCLGMQLLCRSSEENGTKCLGLMPYNVRRFNARGIKVPHMGWNNLSGLKCPLFAGIQEEERVYFVHSYYVEVSSETTATTEYGVHFSAAVSHKNFYAVQFHPEKSGKAGAKILENFLNL